MELQLPFAAYEERSKERGQGDVGFAERAGCAVREHPFAV